MDNRVLYNDTLISFTQSLLQKLNKEIDYNLLSSVVIAFILGIVSSQNSQLSFWQLVWVFCFLIIAIACHYKQSRHSNLTICLLFFTLGILHNTHYSITPNQENHVWNRIDSPQEVVLIGYLNSMVAFDGKSSRAEVDSQFLKFKGDSDLQPTKGRVSLFLPGAWPQALVPGTLVAIRTKLKRPTSYRAQGAFDYAQFLAQKKIWITGSIASPLFIHKVEEKHSIFRTLLYTPEKIRDWVGYKIDATVPNTAGLYRAILLGDKSRVDETTLEAFKACGLMHILAISGLHVAVIASFIYAIIFFVLRRSTYLMLHYDIRKIAGLLCLPPLICYSLITGCNTPVIRALLMASIVLIALCVNRRKSPAPLLFLAAFIILLFNPQQLFTASFLLSFAAMFGILFFIPALKDIFSQTNGEQTTTIWQICKKTLLAALLVSVIATFATLPILLYSFNRVSLVGPIVNIIVEPLICLWSLPFGITALPLFYFFPNVGATILHIGSYGLSLATDLSQFLSNHFFTQVWFPSPAKWIIFIYYLGWILLITKGSKKIKVAGACGVILSIFLFVFPPQQLTGRWNKQNSVSFLDVGQGSSTLIELAGGYRILIDGGGSAYSRRTVGSKVIAPVLWKKGIKNLDAIFITHGDGDHTNGIPFILEHFHLKEIIVPNKKALPASLRKALQDAITRGSIIRVAEEGEIFNYGQAEIKCIFNFIKDRPGVTRDEQNRGLILKLETSNSSALFPGDIDTVAEQQLLKKDIQSDILLSPHHGSITSNSEQFLQTVDPKTIIVSSATREKQSFPHPTIRQRFEQMKFPLLETSGLGTIEIDITKKRHVCRGLSKKDNNPLRDYLRQDLDCHTSSSTSASSR